MNDLGLTLGWLAVQVALILVPALALNALAWRRGPASGAWVATLSLGLVVALGPFAFGPESRPADRGPGPVVTSVSTLPTAPSRPSAQRPAWNGPGIDADLVRSEGFEARPSLQFRWAWDQIGRGASAPVVRFRPWGRSIAIVAMTGTGLGLIRLIIGLWAVELCRRRGRVVEDPEMVGLLEELRGRMGCRAWVELREVQDLSTPATAGWRRPMLLLPIDWPTWDDDERRAVFAHELAHIVRGDYAAGLLARMAVVLHAYHPMVRWMAARLHFQQELAADLLGARFSGGRSRYLVALSRLALKQDGQFPSWPVRAFLPARGTLIRRITMLKNEDESKLISSQSLVKGRLASTCGLLALTLAVATLKGPAWAENKPLANRVYADIVANVDEAPTGRLMFSEGLAKGGNEAPPADPEIHHPPFEVRYLSEKMTGLIGFRPAATARRWGTGRLTPWLGELLAGDFSMIARELKADRSQPGFVMLGCEDIESVVCGFEFGETVGNLQGVGQAPEKPLHTIQSRGLTVRTVAPFDWLAFFRRWNLELEEVRDARSVYYRTQVAGLKLQAAIYLPDDRTLVFETEKWIRHLIGRQVQTVPDYLQGPDWDQVSRGLLAVALNTQHESFKKSYDLGRPDDAIVLSMFQGVDRWVLGLDDADSLSLKAQATCSNPESARSIALAIEPLLRLARAEVEAPVTEAMTAAVPGLDRMLGIGKRFLDKLRVEPAGDSLRLNSEEFAGFGEVISIVEASTPPKAQAADAEVKRVKR